MSIEIRCPGCHVQLKAQQQWANRRFRCPKCGVAVQVPVSQPSQVPDGAVVKVPHASDSDHYRFAREVTETRPKSVARPARAVELPAPCPSCGSKARPNELPCAAGGFDLRKKQEPMTATGPGRESAHLDFPHPAAPVVLVILYLMAMLMLAAVVGAGIHPIAGVLVGGAACVGAVPIYRYGAKASYVRYQVRRTGPEQPASFRGRSRVGFLEMAMFPEVSLKEYSVISAEEGVTANEVDLEAAKNFLLYVLLVVFTGGLALPIIFLFGLKTGADSAPATITFAKPAVKAADQVFAPKTANVQVRFPNNERMIKVAKLVERATGLDIEWWE